MSRAILDAPMTWPASSLMGEMVSETRTGWPSLRSRSVLPPRQNSCRLDRILILGALKELMWLATDKHSRIVR